MRQAATALALIVATLACSTPGAKSTSASPSHITAPQVMAAVPDPMNVAVGDFNGDGKLDLATASNSSPVVGVLLGRGDGTFNEMSSIGAGQAGSFVLAADLDGDGHLDLATSNEDGTATVLWGKGDGTFSAPASYDVKGGLAQGGATWVAAADLNADGALDLVLAVNLVTGVDLSAPGQVAVLLNRGSRSFAKPVFYPDRAAVAVAAGDFDGDGKVDIATADSDRTVRVFRGDGKGRLAPATSNAIDGQGVSIAVGDFNGDNVIDLATGNDRSFTLSILLGRGHGTFAKSLSREAGNTHTIAIVDMDRDGHVDVIAGGFDETFVRLYRGRGDGTFFDQVKIDTRPSAVRGVAAGDFNGDGKVDLAVADGALSIQVLIGA